MAYINYTTGNDDQEDILDTGEETGGHDITESPYSSRFMLQYIGMVIRTPSLNHVALKV